MSLDDKSVDSLERGGPGTRQALCPGWFFMSEALQLPKESYSEVAVSTIMIEEGESLRGKA